MLSRVVKVHLRRVAQPAATGRSGLSLRLAWGPAAARGRVSRFGIDTGLH